MSKADKEHMIRLEGMEYALSVAKKSRCGRFRK